MSENTPILLIEAKKCISYEKNIFENKNFFEMKSKNQMNRYPLKVNLFFHLSLQENQLLFFDNSVSIVFHIELCEQKKIYLFFSKKLKEKIESIIRSSEI